MRKFKRFALVLSACMIAGIFNSCDNSKKESKSEKSEGSYSSGVITPDSDSDEAALGEYVVSPGGIKLYYNAEEIPAELMTAMEEYFQALANKDYESYLNIIYPKYREIYSSYLLETDTIGYDLAESFNKQCSNYTEQMGGDFKITRIKAELPTEDGVEDYLTYHEEIIGRDFANQMKNNCDKLYDIVFFVMVDCDGKESLLASEKEMILAEKDGKFYVLA